MKIKGSIKDKKTFGPIEGARIELTVSGLQIAVLSSDRNGRFEKGLSTELSGQTVLWTVEQEGYEGEHGSVQATQEETLLEVGLTPKKRAALPRERLVLSWRYLLLATACAAVLGVGVWRFSTRGPSIEKFYAKPKAIPMLDSLIIVWQTKNAENVTLNGKKLETTKGKKQISLSKDTTFILKAMKGNKTISETVTVRVKPHRLVGFWHREDGKNQYNEIRISENDERMTAQVSGINDTYPVSIMDGRKGGFHIRKGSMTCLVKLAVLEGDNELISDTFCPGVPGTYPTRYKK